MGYESCTECGGLIYQYAKAPAATDLLCGVCRDFKLNLNVEVEHVNLVRCPHCYHPSTIEEVDGGQVQYTEGTHDVMCPQCGVEFEIKTHVSYHYTSPACGER